MSLALAYDNYYSPEADAQYMSASQFKQFMDCEAAAMAQLRGEWEPETTDAMLVGSYVNAAIEGTLEQFKAAHPELFTRKGELKAEFRQAEEMVRALTTDEVVMDFLTGLHEFIVWDVEFGGATWKAKLDVYDPDRGRIVDLKTCKSLTDRTYDRLQGRYVSWIEPYLRQVAIYAELERRWTGRESWLPVYIVAVTKETPPDKAVIEVDADRIAYELEQVDSMMPRVLAVKEGRADPIRCERCQYCRSTKKVRRVMHYSELL